MDKGEIGESGYVEAFAGIVVDRSRLVIIALLLLTLLIGAGIAGLGMAEGDLGSASDERQAYDYVHSTFEAEERHRTLLVVNDANTLAKESLQKQLHLQETLVSDQSVAASIESEHAVQGVANAIAVAGIMEERVGEVALSGSVNGEFPDDDHASQHALSGSNVDQTVGGGDDTPPTLAEQQTHLASMSQVEIEETLAQLLEEEHTAGTVESFLPNDFDASSPSAESTLIAITHDTVATEDQRLDAYDSIHQIATEQLSDEAVVFSQDRMDREVGQSTEDSLVLVGPLVLLLAILALAIAYQDLIDIALGLLGVLVVILWMAGFMGWAGIEFHFLFVAIPLMLVGLAIDFSIHLMMRYREEHGAEVTHPDGHPGVRRAMKGGLVGVGGAFLWVTLTTSTGFLSNLVSNITEIQEFGLVLAAGIVATCVVFSTLIPALKVEVDEWLVTQGYSRQKAAFGTTGRLRRLLEGIASVATARPVLVIGLVLLLSLGGAYGATHVDTDSDMQMFGPEQPPSWMEHLPEPFSPGAYHASANVDVIETQYSRDDTLGWVLIRGDITQAEALQTIVDAHEAGAELDLVIDVDSVFSRMKHVATVNSSFNQTYFAADSSGDGIPDTDLTTLYDAFYEAAPAEAEGVLYKESEGYEAFLVIVTVEPGASTATIDAETRAIAAATDDGEFSVTPTGRPVAAHTAQTNSRQAAIESVTITVIVILALLTVGYRRYHNSWTLGGVTFLPMALLLSWVFGTMAVLEVPLNALTAVIASFSVALGVDYTIHISERFYDELLRDGSVDKAITRSVVGTGGALAGSALTTASAFGILVLAINPALEQFGIVMGLTVVYAFLGAVVLLPSLLVLWARLIDPMKNGEETDNPNTQQ